MYSVKVYARKNAVMIDSQVFATHADAVEYFDNTGIGEGYWSELHREHLGYSVMLHSNV